MIEIRRRPGSPRPPWLRIRRARVENNKKPPSLATRLVVASRAALVAASSPAPSPVGLGALDFVAFRVAP
jgi:hypothetical protein